MLESIQRGDICIFQNGEEAMVTDFKLDPYKSNLIKLFFNKDVKGKDCNQNNWNYNINGKWIGNGNNIVKVIHR